MKRCQSLWIGLMVIAGACSSAPPEPADMPEPATKIMSWGDLLSRERPEPTATIRYGDGETGVVDVWVPDGVGPHPVVVMVHGGCWQKSIADRTLMNYAAEDLRQSGLAVWNIEYRGVDEAGGGYPGTFEDVAAAADALRGAAGRFDLDTEAVLGFGHSAGGHLLAWLAGRENLPASSPLCRPDPLAFDFIVNSGGLADLEASAPVTQPECLANIMDDLTGEASESRPDVFADTSPARLLPTKAVQASVNGAEDRIAPPKLGAWYTAKVEGAGGKGEAVVIAGSGHVELIAPGTEAFERQKQLLLSAAGR